MQVIMPDKVAKFLEKRIKKDYDGIIKVRIFLEQLENAQNPCTFAGAVKVESKKGSGNVWRWRTGNYRIIGDVKSAELVISIIKIEKRDEKTYKGA